jgi:hypothetical protein
MGCVRQSTVARARGDAVAAFIKPHGHLLVDSPCPDEHAPERNGGGDYGHNHKCHTKATRRTGQCRDVVEANESNADDEKVPRLKEEECRTCIVHQRHERPPRIERLVGTGTNSCLYAVADLSRSTSRRWTISLMGTRRETSGAKTPA